jgi:hypothetical protein
MLGWLFHDWQNGRLMINHCNIIVVFAMKMGYRELRREGIRCLLLAFFVNATDLGRSEVHVSLTVIVIIVNRPIIRSLTIILYILVNILSDVLGTLQ